MWLRGLLVARWRHMLAVSLGIVAVTGLIGLIGVFGISSAATMTARALSVVPVDWQVALTPGADAAALTAKLKAGAPIRAAQIVGYADSASFTAKVGGSTQTTGSGEIVGLPLNYAKAFPGQIRPLLGATEGVLLAQQTAANLHATLGDVITVSPSGGTSFDVVVAGVVDLPNAELMFQVVGPQKGPTATAPPDNVILLPMEMWRAHFAQAAGTPGGGARLQIHASLDHARLPASPDSAYAKATSLAKNFEVRAAGEAMVGDNLAARLDAVRQDAIFARILLLFLGLPGGVLALLLTIAMVRSDAARRRRDDALLGLRGATLSRISTLVALEAGIVALFGGVAGAALAVIVASVALRIDFWDSEFVAWITLTAIVSFVVAIAAMAAPAVIELRQSSIVERRASIRADVPGLWRRTFVDVILLVVAALIYWRSAATGYQLVLAPEGVAATSVDYTAFLAPLFFWTGCGLLTIRLVGFVLRHARAAISLLLRPLAGRLARPSPPL